MRRTTRITLGALVGGLALAGAALYTTRPAGAQAQRQQIGSVSARAPRSTVTLGKDQTEIELTGGVSIQTDAGDILQAQRIVMVVGPMPDPARPGQTRTDVRTATAAGNVRYKRVTTVRPGQGSPYQRVVNGTAERGELDRVTNRMVLLRGVEVQSTDPVATYTLQNVGSAAMNLATSRITADAPSSGKMKMNARQRVAPDTGAPYTRTINASARHADVNQAANTALLSGDVDISADEPTATYTWKNAARATVNFNTQKVEADAPDGQQMNVDVRFKERPQAAGKAAP